MTVVDIIIWHSVSVARLREPTHPSIMQCGTQPQTLQSRSRAQPPGQCCMRHSGELTRKPRRSSALPAPSSAFGTGSVPRLFLRPESRLLRNPSLPGSGSSLPCSGTVVCPLLAALFVLEGPGTPHDRDLGGLPPVFLLPAPAAAGVGWSLPLVVASISLPFFRRAATASSSASGGSGATAPLAATQQKRPIACRRTNRWQKERDLIQNLVPSLGRTGVERC